MLYLILKWQGAFYHPWFYCEREREAKEQVRLASSPSRERSAFEKYYTKNSISYRGSIAWNLLHPSLTSTRAYDDAFMKPVKPQDPHTNSPN